MIAPMRAKTAGHARLVSSLPSAGSLPHWCDRGCWNAWLYSPTRYSPPRLRPNLGELGIILGHVRGGCRLPNNVMANFPILPPQLPLLCWTACRPRRPTRRPFVTSWWCTAPTFRIDHDYTARLHGGDGTAGLACVLQAARDAGADVVLLAGDTFDCHRLPDDLLARAASVIAAASLPVVVLPGNHDPAVADAVYHRGVLAESQSTCARHHPRRGDRLPGVELEIWGRAHRDYGDMIPFEQVRPRRTRWQIAAAHGHYVPIPDRSTRLRPSWLIGDAEIAATGADYVALRHWNRAAKVGDGVAAYYSGSPEYAGTVNVVRLTHAGGVVVAHRARHCPRTFGLNRGSQALRPHAKAGKIARREVVMRRFVAVSVACLASGVLAGIVALAAPAHPQGASPPGTWVPKTSMPALRGEVAAAWSATSFMRSAALSIARRWRATRNTTPRPIAGASGRRCAAARSPRRRGREREDLHVRRLHIVGPSGLRGRRVRSTTLPATSGARFRR